MSVQENHPVAYMAQTDSFSEHVAYGVVDDVEGVVGRVRNIDQCAVVVPFRECAGCQFCIQMVCDPFLETVV
mgnify:CR=1 FL=1